jgi:fatty-acid desaturase
MPNRQNDDSSADIGLATTKDGAVVGAVFAIALLTGIIKVKMLSQKAAIWLLLVIGLAVAVHRLMAHESLFIAPVDGFVIGFGLIFSLLNIIFGNIP